MTQEENLFVVAMEACGELSQEISRTLRFGPYNHAPDESDTTNIDRIRIEFTKLKAVINQIDENYTQEVSDAVLRDVYHNKLIALEQWAEVSRIEGCIK